MPNQELKTGLTRRTVLLAAASIAPVLSMAATTAEAGTMPQKAVMYQDTPKDGKQCSDCTFFIVPNSCKMVAGTIAATGWCNLWSKKAA